MSAAGWGVGVVSAVEGVDDVVGCSPAVVFGDMGRSYSWPFTIPPCVGVMAPTSATVLRGLVAKEVGYVAAIHPLEAQRDS